MYIGEIESRNYKSLILLKELIDGRTFRTVLNGSDNLLNGIFTELLNKGYVETSFLKYKITEKGINAYDLFMKRYSEYLRYYDIFSFVDLEKGEFAFANYFNFETDEEWELYKMDSRFDDVRLAVASYKKINPAEIVFMSFLSDGRFDTQSVGWQANLVSNIIWDEINLICSTAIKHEELGQDVIEDIIQQGSQLMLELIKEENRRNQENLATTEVVEETIIEETIIDDDYDEYVYYEPYCYDPFYISPIWITPIFIW
jgi:hypothetical protein